MSDPLSIAAGVVGLLQVTYSVAAELKSFYDGVQVVNESVHALQQEVDILNQVLESARTTFEAITADYGSGLLASHWRNVAHLIDNCKGVVSHFCHDLIEINKPCSTLDRTRKQMRLRFAEDKVANFRVLVQGFHGSLSVSLQSIMLFNQASLQRTVESALPNLSELEKDVRRIALQLKDILHDRGSKEPEEICAFDQMRECVRTAKSVISSATTVAESVNKHSAVKSDCGTAAADSDFNDCFSPMQEKLLLRRYMVSRCSYEDRVAAYTAPTYFAKHHAHDLPEEHSDSDVEIHYDVAGTHLNSGRDLISRGDFTAAEKKLRNCLHRLSNSRMRNNISPGAVTIKLSAMDGLLDIYRRQQRWSDSVEILQAKISLQEKFDQEDDRARLDDLSTLAQVLIADGSKNEAHPYARKALRGFKRLGDQVKTASCLQLLAEIHDEESQSEAEIVAAFPMVADLEPGPASINQLDISETPRAEKETWSPDGVASQLSLKQHSPLSPPATPDEHERQPSPSRPSLKRHPTYNKSKRPPTPGSPDLRSHELPPEIVITPTEELETILTIDTHTSAVGSVNLTTRSGRGRRSNSEAGIETDEDGTGRSGDETDKNTRGSRRLSISSSLRNKSPKSKTRKVKVATVGDVNSDPAGVLCRFSQSVGKGSIPATHKNGGEFLHNIDLDGKTIELEISTIDDTSSAVGLPPLPSTLNTILACFSVGSPDSLQNLRTKWIPRIMQSCPSVPIIIVGTQTELREDFQTAQELAQVFQHPVTRLEGQDMLRRTGARKYMECSAKMGEGVREVFEEAGRLGSMHVKRLKSRWNLFS